MRGIEFFQWAKKTQLRQIFRRKRSKIGALFSSSLSMQSRKTKKRKKRPTLEKKDAGVEERRGRREGGRGYLSCGITSGRQNPMQKWQFKFFLKFSGPLSRTSPELGLVAPFLHPYWVKSCFRPNPLSVIGWSRCLAVFGLVGGFLFLFFIVFLYFLNHLNIVTIGCYCTEYLGTSRYMVLYPTKTITTTLDM